MGMRKSGYRFFAPIPCQQKNHGPWSMVQEVLDDPSATDIGDAPHALAGVVRNQKTAVFGQSQAGGPAPDFGAVLAAGAKAGGEILVIAGRPVAFEGNEDDLIAAGIGGIPRAAQSDKGAAAEMFRQIGAGREYQPDRCRMGA